MSTTAAVGAAAVVVSSGSFWPIDQADALPKLLIVAGTLIFTVMACAISSIIYLKISSKQKSTHTEKSK